MVFLWLYTIFKRYPWFLGRFTEDGGERTCITKGSVRKTYFLISMINNILEDGIFMTLWLYTIFKRYPWVLGSFTEDGGERQEICLRCRRRHRHTWGTPQIWNHFQCSTKHLRIYCCIKSSLKTSITFILMFLNSGQIFASESERI